MKKIVKRILPMALALSFAVSAAVPAEAGELGFFGGISQGRRLPKTTEVLLEQTGTSRATNTAIPYKEIIFLNGTPTEYEGLLTIRRGAVGTADVGSYTESYSTSQSASTDDRTRIERNITFNVNYRREGAQTIKDYTNGTWRETITVGEETYTLDPAQSYFNISILEDHTPGVMYYKGNISQKAVYTSEAGTTTMELSGSLYGYNSAWSSTEAQRLDYSIDKGNWQMQYQVRPSVSVNKTLQYSQNEPTAISFAGNYLEILQNRSGLQYDIFVRPVQFTDQPTSGSATVASQNSFEQLIAPNLDYLKGHWAESDIRKLFSMQILTGEPKQYVPSQAITRGQFMEMLVRAIKLPIEPVPKTNTRRRQTPYIVFPDINTERADYQYIMAAYKAKLAVGRQDGNFHADASIVRQEAIVYLVRALGLENLGLDPVVVTPFVDDAQVADWAKKEVYAAKRLGLIGENAEGGVNPTALMSKAEAAALINRLVDYMRHDLQIDYAENIVNYAN